MTFIYLFMREDKMSMFFLNKINMVYFREKFKILVFIQNIFIELDYNI